MVDLLISSPAEIAAFVFIKWPVTALVTRLMTTVSLPLTTLTLTLGSGFLALLVELFKEVIFSDFFNRHIKGST